MAREYMEIGSPPCYHPFEKLKSYLLGLQRLFTITYSEIVSDFDSELVKLKFRIVSGTCYISSILQFVSYLHLLFMYQASR